MRRAYAIPYEAFEIADYQAKYYVIMRTSVEQDVRLVGTANPSSVLKMCEKADEYCNYVAESRIVLNKASAAMNIQQMTLKMHTLGLVYCRRHGLDVSCNDGGPISEEDIEVLRKCYEKDSLMTYLPEPRLAEDVLDNFALQFVMTDINIAVRRTKQVIILLNKTS